MNLNQFRIPWQFPPVVPVEDHSKLAIAAVAFCALALGFAYFVMKWATDRMKDWESVKEPRDRRGAPALVCFTAGVGELTSCLLAAHVFTGLYFRLNNELYWWHGVMALGMVTTCMIHWLLLLNILFWYFRNRGRIDPLNERKLGQIIHWHPVLWGTVFLFVLTGAGSLIEIGFGDPLAGFMALLYEFCGAYGIGAYCALRGDLFPRACVADANASTAAPNTAPGPASEATQAG